MKSDLLWLSGWCNQSRFLLKSYALWSPSRKAESNSGLSPGESEYPEFNIELLVREIGNLELNIDSSVSGTWNPMLNIEFSVGAYQLFASDRLSPKV